MGNLVHDLGFEKVHELDYWGVYEREGLSITLTPCHHWGARVLHDQHRGFGGFVLSAGGRSVFHCGDTAFFDGFAEIGRRCPVEIALLPIGAYDAPSGRAVHMNPEEAVTAFLQLQAKCLVPMHYGTFRLSYEPLNEPPQRLLARAREAGVESSVCLMDEGQPRVFLSSAGSYIVALRNAVTPTTVSPSRIVSRCMEPSTSVLATACFGPSP